MIYKQRGNPDAQVTRERLRELGGDADFGAAGGMREGDRQTTPPARACRAYHAIRCRR